MYRILLPLLLLLLVSPSLSHSRTLLNDPAITPDTADSIILTKTSFGVTNVDSIKFDNKTGERILILTLVTTSCTGCSVVVSLIGTAPNGADVAWGSGTAVVSSTTQHIIFGNGAPTAPSGLVQGGRTELPPTFRVNVANSAGTVNFTLTGFTYYKGSTY